MEHTQISEAAAALHQEARQHGGRGEYDLSIEKLLKANELAPEWAYPVYDLGFTYLLKQDFETALKYYEMTDQMEPKGFFTAKTALWSLKKELAGEFPKGLYLGYMRVEWMQSDEEKVQYAKAIVEKIPNYAPAWKEIAGKSNNHAERLQAIEKGLNANPDAETEGMLLINKALIFDVNGETNKAKSILSQLMNNKSVTTSNFELAKLVLNSFENKK